MIPAIIYLGPIPIYSFGLMMALAFLGAGVLLERELWSRGIDKQYADKLLFVGGIAGVLGAKIMYTASYLPFTLQNLFSAAGFTFHGGLIAAILALAIYCKLNKLRILSVSDAAALPLAFGYMVGRLGCQLSGDGDYGVAGSGLLHMSFATGVVPTEPGVLALATPFIESVAALGAIIILGLYRRYAIPGQLAALYLFLSAVTRFIIEFYRIEYVTSFGVTEAQLVYVALGSLALMALLYLQRASSSTNMGSRTGN